MQNEQLDFKISGIMHLPELIEAACKEYKIDNNDFSDKNCGQHQLP